MGAFTHCMERAILTVWKELVANIILWEHFKNMIPVRQSFLSRIDSRAYSIEHTKFHSCHFIRLYFSS